MAFGQPKSTREEVFGDPAHQEPIFQHMFEGSGPQQWARWLRAPLKHACEEGDADLVETLLEAGADGTAKGLGEDGTTLLHFGAFHGSERVVWALLNAGAKPDIDVVASARTKLTPLQVAVRRGHEAAARVLVAAGADVSSTLVHAIAGGDEKLAHDLLLAGADPNDASHAFSPLVLASRKGFDRLVSALLQKGATPARNDLSPLQEAARGGHISIAKSLVAAGYHPNHFDCFEGHTPLHTAALGDGIAGNQVAMVDFLVSAGADVNAQLYEPDGLHVSPLHTAAGAGNREIALSLLQHGADVHAAEDIFGNRPLHAACARLRVEAAEVLLRWDADETAVNKAGKTAIDVASASEHLDSEAWRETRERLLTLLHRAPHERAWRRRSFFALCRAYPLNMQLKLAPHSAGAGPRANTAGVKVARKDSSVGVGGASGGAGAGSGGGGEVDRFDVLASWVMNHPEEGVFRKVVGFL